MVNDPNKPNVDLRSTVVEDENAPLQKVTQSATTTAPMPEAKPDEKKSSSTTTQQSQYSYSSTVPEQFRGSNNAELISYLEKQVKDYKPMTEEQLKKLRKRQRTESIISGISDAVQAVANLIGTHNYAPSMYNAKEGMSAKAKERFDKEKAERDAADDKWFNQVMMLARLKDVDKQQGLQIWQTEQNLARQDRAYEDNKAYQQAQQDRWQQQFDREAKWHDDEAKDRAKAFDEGVRQFNISSANERARLNLEANRLNQSMKEGQMTFNLGAGNGNVTLTLDKLNAQTVSRIYSTLPDEERAKVQGEPIVQNGFVVGYKPPTTEAMLIAIGANVGKSPATQDAIRQVAGLEKGVKPKGYDY